MKQHSEEFWEMKRKMYGIEKTQQDGLRQTIDKNFQTVIIGAIASFEESFGSLWGHGKDEEELSEKELRWLDIWEETRTKILDKGNGRRRATLKSLDDKGERYQYNFKRRPR